MEGKGRVEVQSFLIELIQGVLVLGDVWVFYFFYSSFLGLVVWLVC